MKTQSQNRRISRAFGFTLLLYCFCVAAMWLQLFRSCRKNGLPPPTCKWNLIWREVLNYEMFTFRRMNYASDAPSENRFKSWQATQQGSSGSDCEAEAWGIYSLPRCLLNFSSGEPYNFGRAGGEVEEEGTCKLLGTSSCGIKWGNARGNKLQENVPTPLPNDTTFQPM